MANLPSTFSPLRQIVRLGGVPAAFVSDTMTGETRIDCHPSTGIHNPYDEYCFLARNNECPEAILQSMIQAV